VVRELWLPALGCRYNGSGVISTTTFATCTNADYASLRAPRSSTHGVGLVFGGCDAGGALCHVDVITDVVVGVVVEVTL
jgi:hypothetical protein